MNAMPGENHEVRSTWVPILIRIAVALIILTPFVAIVLQALGKR